MNNEQLTTGLYKVRETVSGTTYSELLEIRHIAKNGRVTVIMSPKNPLIAHCLDLMPHRVAQLEWEKVS